MIKLKTIADLIDYQTDDLTTGFDDSKDIFFKTCDDEYAAILKNDNARSIILLFHSWKDIPNEFYRLVEIKDNKKHGSDLSCLEYLHYEEFREGILHGYHESHYQGGWLEFRGFYKKGLMEGWWEKNYSYMDEKNEYYQLKSINGPNFMFQYINDIHIVELRLLETKNDFIDAAIWQIEESKDYALATDWFVKSREELIRKVLLDNRVYSGNGINYISPSTYKKITNLENLELKWSSYPVYHPVSNYVSKVCKRHTDIIKKANINVNNFPAKTYSLWSD